MQKKSLLQLKLMFNVSDKKFSFEPQKIPRNMLLKFPSQLTSDTSLSWEKYRKINGDDSQHEHIWDRIKWLDALKKSIRDGWS